MKRIITKNWLPLMVTFFLAFSLTLVGAQVFKTFWHNSQVEETAAPSPDAAEGSKNNIGDPQAKTEVGTFIDLQPLIDNWVQETLAGNRNREIGLMIYDLDHNQVAASYNADTTFSADSVYKLIFAYDGYRQIDQGLKIANELYANTGDRGRLTYGECLDLMVRESYSPCADFMRNDKEIYERIEKFTSELDLKNTSDAGLYSTPADLVKFLRYLYQHPDLSESSWQKLADSMLNQPATSYDWRQGLPAGFNQAKVYNKVGWLSERGYWAEYNDVAILDFSNLNRHYAIVVMTEGLPNTTALVTLGNRLEETIMSAE